MSEPIPFAEAGALKRHSDNPLLTRADAPYPCSMLFNAGIAKFQGRYVMVFRNDYGPSIDRVSYAKQREQKLPDFDGTNLGLAFSADGIRWTVLDGRVHMCFAVDTGNGVPAGVVFDGFREDVIFPGGMLLEESGEVKIYYGAADTVECLATAHVDDLLALVGVS